MDTVLLPLDPIELRAWLRAEALRGPTVQGASGVHLADRLDLFWVDADVSSRLLLAMVSLVRAELRPGLDPASTDVVIRSPSLLAELLYALLSAPVAPLPPDQVRLFARDLYEAICAEGSTEETWGLGAPTSFRFLFAAVGLRHAASWFLDPQLGIEVWPRLLGYPDTAPLMFLRLGDLGVQKTGVWLNRLAETLAQDEGLIATLFENLIARQKSEGMERVRAAYWAAPIWPEFLGCLNRALDQATGQVRMDSRCEEGRVGAFVPRGEDMPTVVDSASMAPRVRRVQPVGSLTPIERALLAEGLEIGASLAEEQAQTLYCAEAFRQAASAIFSWSTAEERAGIAGPMSDLRSVQAMSLVEREWVARGLRRCIAFCEEGVEVTLGRRLFALARSVERLNLESTGPLCGETCAGTVPWSEEEAPWEWGGRESPVDRINPLLPSDCVRVPGSGSSIGQGSGFLDRIY